VEGQRNISVDKNDASSKLTRFLVVTRWVVLVVFAAFLGFHYLQPDSAPQMQQDYIVDINKDDAEAISEAIAGQAPDVDLYINATSIKLVEMGHQLIDEPRYRAYVAKQLHALSTDPALFGDDVTSYLALRMAYWQLRHDPQMSGSAEAALLMWQAAERIDRVDRYRSAQIGHLSTDPQQN